MKTKDGIGERVVSKRKKLGLALCFAAFLIFSLLLPVRAYSQKTAFVDGGSMAIAAGTATVLATLFVFLGVGAHQGLRLGVPGEDLPGIIESVEFLRKGNLGELMSVGVRVGIVGGGNVALDAARMSLRLGAKK
jgi:hypothetical protein